jgi:hypothetical protein
MRDLHSAGVGGITCYQVHGRRSERPTFLYSTVDSKFIVCRRH